MPQSPPRDSTFKWLEFTDFSAGIFSNNRLQGGIQVTSTNPAIADPTATFRCIALPNGGLGPLPRLRASRGLTTRPDSGGGYTYKVCGFSTWGRVQNVPNSGSAIQLTELHVVVYYEMGGTPNTRLKWLREGVMYDATPATETIESRSSTGTSGTRYAYLLKTRMNPTTPTDPGTPVMVCVANRVANNDSQISRAWPDPAAPTTNATVVVGDEAYPIIISGAHQNRIILGKYVAYDHGVNANLITNENILWTDVNDNSLVSTTPAQFVPELDQSVIDICPMSANALLVVKWYGGGYVLQGDLSDVTVVQLPNLPCPDGSDYVRGVNTSKGFIYSAGPAGMYLWNGGDGAELISSQLDGNFAVGSNFISGPNGQCDRWIDKVLVPQNWLYDIESKSWWRIEDPATANIRFWSTVAYQGYAVGATQSFTDASPNFMHEFRYDDLAYTYSWLSHPLWVTQDRIIETREVVVAMQGKGSITITVLDEAGTTSAATFTCTDDDMIHNFRANLSMIAQNMRVKITSTGVGAGAAGADVAAPLLHRLFIGYDTNRHLALT